MSDLELLASEFFQKHKELDRRYVSLEFRRDANGELYVKDWQFCAPPGYAVTGQWPGIDDVLTFYCGAALHVRLPSGSAETLFSRSESIHSDECNCNREEEEDE